MGRPIAHDVDEEGIEEGGQERFRAGRVEGQFIEQEGAGGGERGVSRQFVVGEVEERGESAKPGERSALETAVSATGEAAKGTGAGGRSLALGDVGDGLSRGGGVMKQGVGVALGDEYEIASGEGQGIVAWLEEPAMPLDDEVEDAIGGGGKRDAPGSAEGGAGEEDTMGAGDAEPIVHGVHSGDGSRK